MKLRLRHPMQSITRLEVAGIGVVIFRDQVSEMIFDTDNPVHRRFIDRLVLCEGGVKIPVDDSPPKTKRTYKKRMKNTQSIKQTDGDNDEQKD